MASLLEKDNKLLKGKSTALELKRLNQRKQGGFGGSQGTAVDGNLANNNIYKQPTEAGMQVPLFGEPPSPNITATTTPTGNLNQIQQQAISELETAALGAPVARAEGPAYQATRSIDEQAQTDPLLAAVLEERRNTGEPGPSQQGAFNSQGERLGGSGGGTFSTVGQEDYSIQPDGAGIGSANEAFLNEFRAKRAAKIQSTGDAERRGGILRRDEKTREENRKQIESRLFQSGVGRYRANAERDAKILGDLDLSGATDATRDTLKSELALEEQRIANRTALQEQQEASQASLASTARQSAADQFKQGLDIAKFQSDVEDRGFNRQQSKARDLREQKSLGADIKEKKSQAERREAQTEIEAARALTGASKEERLAAQGVLSTIRDTAETSPAALPAVIEATVSRLGNKKTQRAFLTNLGLGEGDLGISRDELSRIATDLGLFEKETN